MKIFIDFDDTLFDSRRYSALLFEIFKRPGIDKNGPELFSYEETKKCYDAVYNRGTQRGYAGPKAQLEEMRRIFPQKHFDMDNALGEIKILNQQLKDNGYVFDGNYELIEKMQQKHEVYLITVGNIEFQKSKVRSCGIESLIGVDRCIYTTMPKEYILKKYVEPNERFMLIEDKDTTIANVVKEFKDVIIIEANRGKIKMTSECYA